VVPEEASIILDSNSHAFKLASLTPLSTAIPKMPSWKNVATFDQTDSDKHIKKRR